MQDINKILWQRSVKLHILSSDRMVNPKDFCVQNLPLKSLKHWFPGWAVHLIPQKWMVKGRHMHTNLMSPSCLQAAADICEFPKPLQNLVVGYGRLSILIIDAHLLPIRQVSPNRRINRP